MVCDRCKMVIRSELEQLGIYPVAMDLGEIELEETDLSARTKDKLLERLQLLGFDLIEDKKSKTVEKIKNLIIELIYNKNNELDNNLSDYLSNKLLQDYNSLSNLFSEIEATTIEKYYIQQKIERVKELLTYNELTINEIAFQLHYSSTAHLSNQFKKITGYSPTYFKQLKKNTRKEIDQL